MFTNDSSSRQGRRGWAVACAVAAIALTGAIPAGAVTPPGGLASKATRLVGSGSDTTYNLQVALDALFNASPGGQASARLSTDPKPLDGSLLNPTDQPADAVFTENYAHDTVAELFPVGGGSGVKQVGTEVAGAAGSAASAYGVDFARNIGTLSASDPKDLRTVAYGQDAITWVAFGKAHGVTNLTQAQLTGIWGGSITTWGQLNPTLTGKKAANPIVVYTTYQAASLRKNWETYIHVSNSAIASPDANHIIRQNNTYQIVANGDAKNAIYFASVGAWKTNHAFKDKSVLGAVDGVVPTDANVKNGTFPFTQYVGNVYAFDPGNSTLGTTGYAKVAANAATVNYVGPNGWICKDQALHGINPYTGNNYRTDIANTIRAQGFFPLNWDYTYASGSTDQSYCRVFDNV